MFELEYEDNYRKIKVKTVQEFALNVQTLSVISAVEALNSLSPVAKIVLKEILGQPKKYDFKWSGKDFRLWYQIVDLNPADILFTDQTVNGTTFAISEVDALRTLRNALIVFLRAYELTFFDWSYK